MTTHDYSAHQPTPEGGDLATLSKLAQELRAAQRAAESQELELKRAYARVTYLSTETIPELMAELGMKKFETTSGLKIELVKKVHASITQTNLTAAHSWLEENGHGGMIKREIVVAFNREQEEEAKELQDQLRGEYPGVKSKEAVHNSTLKAWVKNRLKAGEHVPDSISHHEIDVATIK